MLLFATNRHSWVVEGIWSCVLCAAQTQFSEIRGKFLHTKFKLYSFYIDILTCASVRNLKIYKSWSQSEGSLTFWQMFKDNITQCVDAHTFMQRFHCLLIAYKLWLEFWFWLISVLINFLINIYNPLLL